MSNKIEIQIISSPRPEDEESWRASFMKRVREQNGELQDGFVECDACAAKIGAQTLCGGCLYNRRLAGERKQDRLKAEAMQFRNEIRR